MNMQDKRHISIWLIGCLILLWLIVIIGGIVRLTRSGLSIVEWKPITGVVPPFSEQEWKQTFELYKQYPEYQNLNRHMTLDEYKYIYWWEFIHRVFARLIGAFFLIPFLYFLWRRSLTKKNIIHFSILFLLGGLQGVIGWYTVKSGLRFDPSVSHYRLSIHLSLAYFIFCYILWLLMRMYFTQKRKLDSNGFVLLRFNQVLLFLISIQTIYGAFVAGLKAGYIYNTFPLMEDSFIPEGLIKMNSFFQDILSNKGMVQFIHRNLAYLLLVLAGIFYFKIKISPSYTLREKKTIQHGFYIMLFQIVLGIFTLIYAVPIWLGVLHQANSVLLIAFYTASLNILLYQKQ